MGGEMTETLSELQERPQVLAAIRPYYEQRSLVKVLTGMRRVGKSTVLKLIAKDLREHGKTDADFFFINCEELRWATHDWQYLAERLQEFAENHSGGYVFLDEVQTIDQWERAVNAIRATERVSLFVTGSNSKLLSGELATFLAGRYVSFQIYPFSFSEFYALKCRLNSTTTQADAFSDYLERGGLPASADGLILKPYEVWQKYLEDIYLAIFVRDIQSRLAVRNSALFLRVLRYLFSEIGHIVTAPNLARSLKESGAEGSKGTILKFITAAEDACLFEAAFICDTKGKQLLKYDRKLYATDHGLRQAVFGNNLSSIDQVLENIVYIELRRRGWKVAVGRVGTKGVDFIADKGPERRYFQVSYLVGGGATEEREFGSLLKIPDNYPKTVLSMDPILRPQKGIEHRNLVEFLLDPAW